MFVRSTLPTDAIRREILSALRTSDAMTVPRATAHVAAVWIGRRRRQGESPSVVESAQSIVFQVGADLADELADRRPSAVRRCAVALRGVVPLPTPRRQPA